MAPNYIVPAVDRTVKVLQSLVHHPRGISLAKLARETEIPKSSLFRILMTLQHHSLVSVDSERETFFLGMKLIEWGSATLERLDLKAVVHPYLGRMAAKTGQSFYLALLNDYEVLLVDRADTPDIWQIVTRLGLRSPVHCTASGLCMISELSDEQISEIVKKKGLPKFTPRTITTEKSLKRKLAEVRRLGYAVADGDFKPDLFALAVVLRDYQGKIVGSLMTALHSASARRSKRLVAFLVKILQEEGCDISKRLGYRGDK